MTAMSQCSTRRARRPPFGRPRSYLFHRRNSMRLTRRQFGAALAVAPFAAAARPVYPTVNGVRLGVQSSSFAYNGMGLGGIMQTMRDLGLAEIDLMSEHVENYLGAPIPLPGTGRGGAPRDALRQWRLEADLDDYHLLAGKFSNA